MGVKTGIEWTDATWNPVRGCSRVSEGCRNCYAEKIAGRFSGKGKPFEGFAMMKHGEARWTGKIELIHERLEDPLDWKRPRKVFVNSMSDLFHESLPFEAVDLIFAAMAQGYWHTYQVLTKRIERMREYFTKRASHPAMTRCFHNFRDYKEPVGPWPLPNVWLGVSVENQDAANERIPHLISTPAALRFVSYEPALGPLDLTTWLSPTRNPSNVIEEAIKSQASECPDRWALHWVIAGGESGPRARPSHPDWFRSVRDQCKAAGVPFFFKQWGNFAPMRDGNHYEARHAAIVSPDGGVWDYTRWKDGPPPNGAIHMAQVGKKAAGNLLDGQRHEEFPA